MKLEVKHLAPYLPYSLKCQIKNPDNKTVYTDTLQAIYNNAIQAECTFFNIVESQQGFEFVKPILRPLHDFHDINCKAVCELGLDLTTQMTLVDLCLGKIHYTGLRHSDTQEFLRHHIDIFGLIEKGLAIDINTL